MEMRLAGTEDLSDIARLLWLNGSPEEQGSQSQQDFATEVQTWWHEHGESHLALLAVEDVAVGMAWVCLVPRPPRPGNSTRTAADLQSVYVLPEHRGRGIGTALVEEALRCAHSRGAERLTVHSGRRAAPLYQRLGFAFDPLLLQRTT